MAKKSKFLKNLLTTASAVAVLAGGVQSAFGANENMQNIAVGAVTLSLGVVNALNVANSTVPATLINPSRNDANFNYRSGGQTDGTTVVTVAGNGDMTFRVIDANGEGTNGGFVIDRNTSIDSIIDSLNSGARINFIVNDGKTMTFAKGAAGKNAAAGVVANQNDFSALGDVQLGTTGNGGLGDAKWIVNTGVSTVFNGAVDGNDDNKGQLEIRSGANVNTFNGDIGSKHRLEHIKVGQGAAGVAVFNGTVKAATITVGGPANNAHTGNATFNANVESANNMDIGIAGGAVGTVTLKGDFNKGITFGNLDGSTLNLAGSNGPNIQTINGNITTTTTTNKNTVNVSGDVVVKGKLGDGAGNVKLKDIHFITNKDKKLTVDNNQDNEGIFAGIVDFAVDGKIEVKNSKAGHGAVKQSIKFDRMTIANNTADTHLILDASIGANSSVDIIGKIGNKANDATRRRLGLLKVDSGVASDDLQYVTLQTLAGGGNNEQTIQKMEFDGPSNLKLNGDGAGGADAFFTIGEFVLSNDNEVSLFVGHDSIIAAMDATNGLKIGDADLDSAAPAPGVTVKKLKAVNFLVNEELKIGDKVEIHARALTNATNDHGKLTFVGSGVFDAPIESGKKIDAIKGPAAGFRGVIAQNIATNADVAGGAGALAFLGDLDAAGKNIVAGGAATASLEFGGNVKAAELDSGLDDNGTLKFVNKSKATITIGRKIGQGTDFNTVEVNGTDVVIPGGIDQPGRTILFSTQSDKPVVLDLGSAPVSVIDNAIITNNGVSGVTHVVQYKADANKTFGVVGSEGHMVELRNTADTNITTAGVGADNLKYAHITNTVDGKGGFTFDLVAGSTVGALGTEEKALKTATFTESGQVMTDAYAALFNVADAKTATFGGVVGGQADNVNSVMKLSTGGVATGGTAIFKDGATVAIKVTEDTATKSTATFEGGVFIQKDIGTATTSLAHVNFNGNSTKTALVGADIYGADIKAKGLDLQFSTDNPNVSRVIYGNSEFSGTTFSLNTVSLDASRGAMTLKDSITINSTIVGSGSNISGGNIDLGKSQVDIQNLNSLNININDTTEIDVQVEGDSRIFRLVDATGPFVTKNGYVIPKLTVTNEGTLSTWKAQFDANSDGILLVQTSNAESVLQSDVNASSSSSPEDLENAAIYALSPSARVLLNRIKDSAKRAEFIQRGVAAVVNQVLGNLVGQTGSAISTRMGNLAGLQGNPAVGRVVASGGVTGVAAGEEDTPAHRFGVWVTPFGGKANQKARGSANGYDSSTYGASFGFDTRANDDVIVGVGASIFNTDVKHKNLKSGDKTKVNSAIFSIYGMQQINDTLFAQGIATFGSSKVKNSERRVLTATTYANVSGEYTSTTFGMEGFLGANVVVMQGYTLTPMIGARYTKISDSSYKETGNTTELLSVSKKNVDKMEGIIGARFAGAKFDLGGMAVTPEIHGFVTHQFNAKEPEVTMKLDNVSRSLNSKAGKSNKTYGSVGLGLNAEQGMMEYGLAYDATMAKKYVAHQGTLKVRVNF